MEPYLVLGIETSCDETSASVVADGREILSNVIASQIDLHREYGGVVPEIASRKHVELILPVIDEALKEAGITLSNLDAIAVTAGPGLVGALLIGVSAGKALSYTCNIPCVGVHHIESHISANYLAHKELEPPFLSLVVSGGHSHIIAVESYTKHKVLGRTRDDAAGEAFDKVARVLGLGYPGGPEIDKMAVQGNVNAFDFPRVKFSEYPYDFSFSGLKTSVINKIHHFEQKNEPVPVADICASFQKAVVDVLTDKAIRAAIDYGYTTICLAGGVASNRSLRDELERKGKVQGIKTLFPPPILCTDNAAMVACMGTIRAKTGVYAKLDLNADPAYPLDEIG